MKTLRNFKRYKPDENSAVFKKFGPYTKLFLQDENGNDWYDAQKLFSSGTLKIGKRPVKDVLRNFWFRCRPQTNELHNIPHFIDF